MHTVDRARNTLVLMDTDGTVLALCEITPTRGGRRRAKRALKRWLETRAFDYAEALNRI